METLECSRSVWNFRPTLIEIQKSPTSETQTMMIWGGICKLVPTFQLAKHYAEMLKQGAATCGNSWGWGVWQEGFRRWKIRFLNLRSKIPKLAIQVFGSFYSAGRFILEIGRTPFFLIGFLIRVSLVTLSSYKATSSPKAIGWVKVAVLSDLTDTVSQNHQCVCSDSADSPNSIGRGSLQNMCNLISRKTNIVTEHGWLEYKPFGSIPSRSKQP